VSVKHKTNGAGFQKQVSTNSNHPRGSSLRTAWIKLEMPTDVGRGLPYYLNTKSTEVVLQEPAGMVLDLPTIRSAVEFLEQRLHLDKLPPNPKDDASIFGASPRATADDIEETIVAAPLGWEQSDEQLRAPIETVARRPGSKFDPRTIPWRYFRKTSLTVATCWFITAVWIVVRHIVFSKWQLPQAALVETEWPHPLFKPSAIACTGDTLVVADRFAIYTAELPAAEDEDQTPLNFQPLLKATERTMQWRSITSQNCAEGTCSALFLLAKDGQSVTEINPGKRAKTYPLGPDVDLDLHAISHMSEEAAEQHCAGETMGLFAATDKGEVLATCLYDGYIMPMYTIASAPASLNTVKATSPDVDLSGPDEFLALDVDEEGALWLMARIADGSQTELRVWTPDGSMRGAWKLPPSPWWASGLCMRPKGDAEKSFLMGSLAKSSGPTSRPQMWQFTLDIAALGMTEDPAAASGMYIFAYVAAFIIFSAFVLRTCCRRSKKNQRASDGSVFASSHGKLSSQQPGARKAWGRQ